MPASRDSPSSTAGRTRSASSSSPTPTPGGSARTRSTRPCVWAKAWRAPARCSRSRWSARWRRSSSTRTSARRRGSSEIRPVATSAIRDASQPGGVPGGGARAVGLDGRGPARARPEARYGYLAAVNSTTLPDGVVLDLGGGSMQLTRVAGRAADRRALVAARRRAHDRALPAPGQARSAPRRCASTSLRELDERRLARRGRAAGRRRRHGAQPRRRRAARGRAAVLRHPGLPGHARRARRADRGVLVDGRAERATSRASRPRAAT